MNEQMMKALKNWRVFNEMLNDIPENQVLEMLEYELLNENRKTFVERLHQRYSTLRAMRERATLMEKFN